MSFVSLASLVLLVLFLRLVVLEKLSLRSQRRAAAQKWAGGGAWAPMFIVARGRRHEVACAPSGDVWMRFDRLLLASAEGQAAPEWIATSEKKGAFIGSRNGNTLTLRGWAGRLLGNEGVMLLHAPIVSGTDGDVPVELELSVGQTADTAPDFVDEVVARLDAEKRKKELAAEKEASAKSGAFYRTQGSTISGGVGKDVPF